MNLIKNRPVQETERCKEVMHIIINSSNQSLNQIAGLENKADGRWSQFHLGTTFHADVCIIFAVLLWFMPSSQYLHDDDWIM